MSATPASPDVPSSSPLEDYVPTPAHRRALMTMATTLFLDLASFGIILPVLPYYAEALQASETAVTLLSTAFSIAQFVMAPVLGRASDRWGRRPVMLISVAGSVAASVVLGFAGTLWLVFAARLLSGASKANVSTAQACVADIVPAHARAKYMGMMGAAIGLGFIFGPAIGGLLSLETMPTLPFFVAAGLSAINFVMAWLWLPETRTESERAAAPVQVGPRPRLWTALWSTRGQPMGWLLAANFLFFMSFAAMEATFALYTSRRFAWASRETGYFLTIMGGCSALVQGVLVGRLSAYRAPVRVLQLGLVAMIGAMVLLALGPDLLGVVVPGPHVGLTAPIIGLMIGCAMLLSLGNGLSMPSFGTIVSLSSSRDEQGANMGLRESTSALARVGGPVLAGLLFEHIAPRASFLGAAVFATMSLVLAVGLGRALGRAPGQASAGPA